MFIYALYNINDYRENVVFYYDLKSSKKFTNLTLIHFYFQSTYYAPFYLPTLIFDCKSDIILDTSVGR